MKRWVLLLALCTCTAFAQSSLELEAFAGSKANLERLTRGLRAGTEVRLVNLTPEGMREIVAFTAAEALTPAQTARVLENARYHLLERGIAEPSGWDIGLVLMGRMDIEPSGPVWRPGLLRPADPKRPLVLSLRSFAGSASNHRNLVRGLRRGADVTLVDPVDERSRLRFSPPCALAQAEVKPALLATAELLAARGLGEPTITELRSAVLEILKQKCA